MFDILTVDIMSFQLWTADIISVDMSAGVSIETVLFINSGDEIVSKLSN
jgi:MinD-like ATPase involved in chromosome partitioning or flagellar assembly